MPASIWLVLPFIGASVKGGLLPLVGGSFGSRGAVALTALSFLQLTHFQAMLLFATLVSLAFGFVSRRRPLARLKYALWSLLLFLVIGIVIAWIMYPFSR